ncbi:c-type cytochrome [Chitiniphilus purpureus]|uniref:C-type cytochrome n=1 Tax=Chitiniphilus purpureus TaxID=2981137 RepID=A0ABY6DRL4_9NEIS|nr:c-type cytochrome [Chitiniphilus sp. CD1]UXY14548.1 c-type cytochrome [Chitiniphilus sp. CD1]
MPVPLMLCVLLACGLSVSGASAADPARIAAGRACMACHAADRALVGPAFKQIAARYQGDPGAPARLARKIRNGGSGAWGRVPMPPSARVTPAEAEQLARWVLQHR